MRFLAPLRYASLALLLAAAAAGGCAKEKEASDDPCDQLLLHLQRDCQLIDGAGGGNNCTGAAACEAECLTKISCEDFSQRGQGFQNCTAVCSGVQ